MFSHEEKFKALERLTNVSFFSVIPFKPVNCNSNSHFLFAFLKKIYILCDCYTLFVFIKFELREARRREKEEQDRKREELAKKEEEERRQRDEEEKKREAQRKQIEEGEYYLHHFCCESCFDNSENNQ